MTKTPGRRGMANLVQTLQKETYSMSQQEIPRTGRLEVNTLPKKDFYPVQINEVGPQQDYVHCRKPSLLDTSVNKQTNHDLERLLEENHDAFADDERLIGTTTLIKMSIDTGDHLPIAKKPYALALKHYDWVRDEIDKLLKAGVI